MRVNKCEKVCLTSRRKRTVCWEIYNNMVCWIIISLSIHFVSKWIEFYKEPDKIIFSWIYYQIMQLQAKCQPSMVFMCARRRKISLNFYHGDAHRRWKSIYQYNRWTWNISDIFYNCFPARCCLNPSYAHSKASYMEWDACYDLWSL